MKTVFGKHILLRRIRNVRRAIFQQTNNTSDTKRLVILKNVAELDTGGTPVGIEIDGSGQASPYSFKQLIVRGNVIRPKENATPPSGTIGIKFNSCAESVVEDNVITVASDNNGFLAVFSGWIVRFHCESSKIRIFPRLDADPRCRFPGRSPLAQVGGIPTLIKAVMMKDWDQGKRIVSAARLSARVAHASWI